MGRIGPCSGIHNFEVSPQAGPLHSSLRFMHDALSNKNKEVGCLSLPPAKVRGRTENRLAAGPHWPQHICAALQAIPIQTLAHELHGSTCSQSPKVSISEKPHQPRKIFETSFQCEAYYWSLTWFIQHTEGCCSRPLHFLKMFHRTVSTWLGEHCLGLK